MAFHWKEFLELARDLTGHTGSGYSVEATNRTAVSRAYYAAFCWARNYAASRMGYQRTGQVEDHASLRAHMKARGKSQTASRLNKLRKWRNQCDYDDHVPNLNTLVQSAIKIADRVIQECK
ncbi:MAG: HEPN domain-containing protein [Acidobacteria bacterium]|nr:MAG: HEPN domain-containing protein [Acidobacteriota bacterium]